MKIILMGYMGSGKTAIGSALADFLNFPFMDLDAIIESKEQISIAEIFKSKGEIYFRRQEHHYLKDLLQKTEDFVLSLGGGTPCYSNNMYLMKSSNNTVTFYLKSSVGNLVDRLSHEKEQRPLISRLNNKEELTEFVAKHLFERNQFYNQADFPITVDNKSVDEIATEILSNLNQ